MWQGNYKDLDNELGDGTMNVRVINGVVTTCPEGKESAYQSSQYFQGDVINYNEETGDVLFQNGDGNFELVNINDGNSAMLNASEDSITDLFEFIEACWLVFPEFDSNVIFDELLIQFNIQC